MPCLRTAKSPNLLGSILVTILLLAGCNRRPDAKVDSIPAAAQTVPSLDAKIVLQRMEQAYREANAYSDRGRVVLGYRERGDIRTDEAPLAVTARKPNALRVEAYYSTIVSDGDLVQAMIADDQSGNIDGQVLHRKLKEESVLELLYQDSTLREAMTSGLGGKPLQLDLLFADDPLESVFAKDKERRSLESAEFEGHVCYRVATDGEEGEFVFWIDSESFVLRQLEFPAASLLPELSNSTRIQDVSLRIEFRDATFEPQVDDAVFQFEVPANAKQVHAFVLPPHPLPTTLFGEVPDDFACYDLQGGVVDQKSLLGKMAVLIWFNGHPACRSTIEQLGKVYAERAKDDAAVFFAVSTEPSSVSNAEIKAALAGWNTNIPLLRDLDACGRDVLGVPWNPTMIVFDAAGAVQIYEVGANADLAHELPLILDRMSKGDDLAGEILAEQDQQTATYRELLNAAMQAAAEPNAEPAPAKNE